MVIINFENNANDIDELFYIKIASDVISYILKQEGCPYESEVSFLLTDNEGIKEINCNFRNKDVETDVLSFPNFAFESPADFAEINKFLNHFDYFNPENQAFYLGDIMISENKARLQAEEYGHSYVREIAFLLAHSTLHLIGYDHMTPEDAVLMEEKQNRYLEELGITRNKNLEISDYLTEK